MKLLPRFIKDTILVAFGHVVKGEGQIQEGMKEVEAEVWADTGLAIHEYNDSIGTGKWRVTHVSSGRSILRHIKNRQEAVYYLMKVKEWETTEGTNIDWAMSEQKFRSMYNREEVVQMLNILQKEISGEVR